MPSDTMLKSMNVMHRGLLKISGGRMGWTAGKMPVLRLTTVGRKSGESRTVMLTSPYQDGDSILIVASKGGEDSHPAWFLNLRDEPSVEVEWQGAPMAPMTARILDSDDRTDVWPKVVDKYANYGGYQEKTDREIPLVMLEPSD